MALDKLVDSTRLDGALTATANAILAKTGGSSALTWDMDDGFSDDIADIPTGTDVSDTTATASDVRTGKYFYTSAGVKTQGTIADQAAQTITPTTTDQTIASGKYLTGAQTIKGDANLVAGNIKKDVTIFGVTGTHEGGGGSTNVTISGAAGGSASYLNGSSVYSYVSLSSNTSITCLSGSLITILCDSTPSYINAIEKENINLGSRAKYTYNIIAQAN